MVGINRTTFNSFINVSIATVSCQLLNYPTMGEFQSYYSRQLLTTSHEKVEAVGNVLRDNNDNESRRRKSGTYWEWK